MKNLLLLLLLVSSISTLYSQTNCAKIKARGYTQEFCDYDKKNGYKNIPFGTDLEVISSRFTLTKSQTNPYDYESKDDEARFWGNVMFDQCLFQFNSEKKLKGVQLQMIGYGSTNKEKKALNMAAWSRIEDYLVHLFGKPENFHGSSLWLGNNIYIVLGGYNSKTDDDGSGFLGIIAQNLNPIEGL